MSSRTPSKGGGQPPTKAEVHQAVQVLLRYGTHGTAPDPPPAPPAAKK